MNFKLLTFIFVIGVQSINSSIINKQSIDELVLTNNLGGKIINSFGIEFPNPYAGIKYLTFNASETVTYKNNWTEPELKCDDKLVVLGNHFCSLDNGKYQAKFVECFNLKYPIGSQFQCKLFNAKVLNKNVQYKDKYIIRAPSDLTVDKSKGYCRMEYAFENSESYKEADDVENKDYILF